MGGEETAALRAETFFIAIFESCYISYSRKHIMSALTVQ